MPLAAVGAIVSAGVGAAQAAGAFNPKTPDAPNYGQMSSDAMRAQLALLPQTVQAHQTWDPQTLELQQQLNYQNLFGTPESTSPGTGMTSQRVYVGDPRFGNGTSNSSNLGMLFVGGGGRGTGQVAYGPGGQPLQQDENGYYYTVTTKATAPVHNPGAPGQLQLMEDAAPRLLALAARTNTAQRSADIADVQNLGGAARTAMRSYDPAATGLLDTLDSQATDQLNANGALDPFTRRVLQQNIRGSQAARGLGYGPGDSAQESYYETSTQEQRRAQNQALAGSVIGQNQNFYGDPFMQILQRSGRGTVPGVPYQAQPNSLVQNGVNPAAYQLGMAGYDAQNQAAGAGYLSQMSGLKTLGGTFGSVASFLK